MMIRALAFAASVSALALPAAAQHTNKADPQMRQHADALVTQYTDALSKGDTAALGSLYTSGAIDFNPFGKIDDASREMQIAEEVHSMGLVEKAKIERVEPFGDNGMLVTGTYTSVFTKNPKIPPGHGNLLFVLERTGDVWKIRAMAHSPVLR